MNIALFKNLHKFGMHIYVNSTLLHLVYACMEMYTRKYACEYIRTCILHYMTMHVYQRSLILMIIMR